MKTKLFLCLLTVLFMLGCQNKKEEAIKHIDVVESQLYGENDNFKFDAEKADEAIQVYLDYANNFPEDTLAPEYLFKAADLYRLKNQPDEALPLYDKIYKEYPDYRKAAHSLFLMGFVYENEVGDLAKAEEKYTEFIQKYPEHDLADDAQFSMQNLGKTPEQIIREFEEREKQDVQKDTVMEEAGV